LVHWGVNRHTVDKSGGLSVIIPLIFTCNNPSMFEDFKKAMTQEFEMTDISLMSYYLGIKVKQMEKGIFISQGSFAREMLKKFKMNNNLLAFQ